MVVPQRSLSVFKQNFVQKSFLWFSAYSPGAEKEADSPIPWQRMTRSRRVLVWSVLTGATLATLAIALGSYQILRALVLRNLEQQISLQVHESGGEIDQWLATRKSEIEALAHSPIVQSLDWTEINPYFDAEISRLKDFPVLVVAHPDGFTCNTLNQCGKVNVRDREWFRRGIAGTSTVGDPIIGRSTGVLSITINAPITRRYLPNPIGVVSGSIKVNQIAQTVGNLRQGNNSYAFVLNSKGSAIFHPDPSMVSTPEKPVPSFLQSSNAELAAIAREMADKKDGLRLISLNNERQYVAYVPLDEANWAIALIVPRQNIERSLGALNLFSSVLGLLLLVALAGVWRQVHRYEQTRRHAQQEALLNRLTNRIRESLDLPTIVQTTVTELAGVGQIQRVLFGWLHPEQQTLQIIGDSAATDVLEQALAARPLNDLVGSLEQGLSLSLVTNEPLFCRFLTLQAGKYTALSVSGQDGQIGYLLALHKGTLDEDDRDLLIAVTDSLAIAVTQANLYRQTQQQVELLNETVTKLNQTQMQLVQSEKMSSLGQLVAGIAHEINNPVNFIHGNLSHANQYAQDLLMLLNLYRTQQPDAVQIQQQIDAIDLEFLCEDFPKVLDSMQMGTQRIREIVQSLRVFSRLDEAAVKKVDIHEGIDSTLMILQNRLNAHSDQRAIAVVKHYGQLPLVECYAGQLNQVFMNILNNAIDAIDAAGIRNQSATATPTITIRTIADPPNPLLPQTPTVSVHIADNGGGIPDDIQPRIFDPFFTTKAIGQGTGMGLAMSYQIIRDRHKGSIDCLSEPGNGTELIVSIPVSQPEYKD